MRKEVKEKEHEIKMLKSKSMLLHKKQEIKPKTEEKCNTLEEKNSRMLEKILILIYISFISNYDNYCRLGPLSVTSYLYLEFHYAL